MDAQVAVIGTGSVGSMALWQLARAGVDAIGFEQYAPGHDQAAAGGESRIFRTAYLEGPQYVPLLQRSLELWRELEAESGQHLLTLNGGLMIGAAESPAMRNVLASARDYELAHTVLEPADMATHYPQHRLQPHEVAVLDHAAGVLRPEFAVLAAARCAEANGAQVVTGGRVEDVQPVDGGVRVTAAGRDYLAKQAIITAGPWVARFAPMLAGDVSARRLVMTWYPALDVAAYQPDRFPIFIRESGDSEVFGIPTLDGGSVKVAPHSSYGGVADPDHLARTVDPAELEPINRAVAELLPGLIPTPVRVSAYMDGYTSDGHGLVGRMPGIDNVWLLGAFSGHGFKMAPSFGQIAMELATQGKTSLPIEHLDPKRFLP
ncbi:MAG: N-methyl-L-tryptophan oxidase [Nocardioidaceae bacterium]